MSHPLTGIHHVTAIAGDPQANVDFYVGVLGLRLVKRTVNFDDPNSYHFYYGDGLGRPGTLLTFFAWPGGRRGRKGLGQVPAVTLSVGPDSLGFWRERLESRGLAVKDRPERFGEKALAFDDPDGMQVELVADSGDARTGWDGGFIPAEHAIRGLHSVALPERSPERTLPLIAGVLGFRSIAAEDGWTRYAVGETGSGAFADLQTVPELMPGQINVGSIHHVAWRTPDDAGQKVWLENLAGLGYDVSPVMDREYFHSIYFREPGGILFEIATDAPGFATDEAPDALGTSLRLPAQYEAMRAQIERTLPPIRLPQSQ